jgi:hypothetical protein
MFDGKVAVAGWNALNEHMLQACKELIDDAKMGCANLVFKEVCLEILCRANHVLSQKQFKQLVAYASERMKESVPFEMQQELAMNR